MDRNKTKKGKIDKETTKDLQSPGIHISNMKMWDEENGKFVEVNNLQAPLDRLIIPKFLKRDE